MFSGCSNGLLSHFYISTRNSNFSDVATGTTLWLFPCYPLIKGLDQVCLLKSIFEWRFMTRDWEAWSDISLFIWPQIICSVWALIHVMMINVRSNTLGFLFIVPSQLILSSNIYHLQGFTSLVRLEISTWTYLSSREQSSKDIFQQWYLIFLYLREWNISSLNLFTIR